MMNKKINKELLALAEEDYRIFNSKLIKTNYPTLGIRIPKLRALAKKLAKESNIIPEYLNKPSFENYESIILYGMTLSYVKELSLENAFLYLDPLILKFDNWAHVDCVTSEIKLLGKHREEVLKHYLHLIEDDGEFTKRFFIILLLSFYIDDEYIDQVLSLLTKIPQGQYYVDMAIAWTLSVTLVKYYDKTLPLLKKKHFSTFVHNKAIQKARESYRVSPETKEYLNTLKIK